MRISPMPPPWGSWSIWYRATQGSLRSRLGYDISSTSWTMGPLLGGFLKPPAMQVVTDCSRPSLLGFLTQR